VLLCSLQYHTFLTMMWQQTFSNSNRFLHFSNQLVHSR
jgi:hypothetical protein